MQRILVYLAIIGLFLAACSPPAGPVIVPTEVAPTPAEPTPSPETPTEEPQPTDVPATNAAIEALAVLLGLDPSQITLVSVEAVDWSDSCLGIVRINALCAAGIVPGYRIILEADGQQYEYHTNGDGTAIAIAPVTVDTAAEAAAQAAKAALMKALGLVDYLVNVVSVTPREWSDACLGVSEPGMVCADVITPGFIVVLEAHEGVLYEYHTNEDGTSVKPATVALTWSRNGGIAGFCDGLLVYRSGEIAVQNCSPETVAQSTLAAISETDVAQFNEWLKAFGEVTIAHDDGAVADSMSISLTLNGIGTAQPTEAEQQALLDWAQNIFTQLQPAG